MYFLKEIIVVDKSIVNRLTEVELLKFRYGGDCSLNETLGALISMATKRHGPLIAILKHDDNIHLYQKLYNEDEIYAGSYGSFKWSD
jgi:hypothetical protein